VCPAALPALTALFWLAWAALFVGFLLLAVPAGGGERSGGVMLRCPLRRSLAAD
jgi:hypothetical protein